MANSTGSVKMVRVDAEFPLQPSSVQEWKHTLTGWSRIVFILHILGSSWLEHSRTTSLTESIHESVYIHRFNDRSDSNPE